MYRCSLYRLEDRERRSIEAMDWTCSVAGLVNGGRMGGIAVLTWRMVRIYLETSLESSKYSFCTCLDLPLHPDGRLSLACLEGTGLYWGSHCTGFLHRTAFPERIMVLSLLRAE